MKRTFALTAWAIVVLMSNLVGTSAAQGVQTGTIRGAVADAQGLPVPAVMITITSPALQGERTTATATDGSYVFAGLTPGPYEMTFQISSFAPVRQTTDVALGL